MKQLLIDPLLGALGLLHRLQTPVRASQWSIIVPICDQFEVANNCLMSIKRWAPDSELIIVNDGSKQSRTREMITQFIERCPCTLIENEEPKGHSEANRQGVAKATRRFLCLLNSDAYLTNNSLMPLEQLLEQKGTGCVGPSTSQTATSQKCFPYAQWRRWEWSIRQMEGFATYCYWRYRFAKPAELPYVGGFALCLSRETWDVSGGFDASLPDYGNEKELCHRLTRNHDKINYWVPKCYVHHLGNLSYKSLGTEEVKRRRMEADRYIDEKNVTVTGRFRENGWIDNRGYS